MTTQRLTPGTAAMLVIPPLLWAGNAVVGRLVHELISPIALNFIRWVLAFGVLLPLAHGVLHLFWDFRHLYRCVCLWKRKSKRHR